MSSRCTRMLVVVVAVAIVVIALSGGIAGATVTQNTRMRTSDTRTSEDPGCRKVDTITLHEDIVGHLVEVNGAIHVDVLMSGTISFDEDGQAFRGTFRQPFTLFQQPDGSIETTQVYTAVAKGNLGDVAMLHVTAHVTFIAPNNLVSSFAILQHECA